MDLLRFPTWSSNSDWVGMKKMYANMDLKRYL